MKKLLLLLAALAAFIILNPYGGLDILAGLVVIGLLLYHLVGDYAILALIAIRPTVDLWRDYIVVSTEEFTVNLNAALSLLLALWAIYFLVKEYQRRKNLPGKYLLIIFIAWSMATLIWSVDRLSTVTETLKIFNLGALFAIGFILSRRDGARFLAKLTPALALGSIPPLATALYQLATGGGQTIDEIPGRLFGTLAHPNVLAFLGLTLIFLLAHQSLQKQAPPPLFPQPVTRLALGILLAITLFTYTRVAWLGAVIFFALLAARWYRRALLFAVTGLALFYLIFFPFNRWLADRSGLDLTALPVIARLTTRTLGADSLAWRLELAEKILPVALARPIHGYGYGTFATVWDNHKGVKNIWDDSSEAHNDYLKLFVEVGAVGLIFYLAFFIILLRAAVQQIRTHGWTRIVFMGSLAIYLILSLSDNMLHHTPVGWWLFTLWGAWAGET